MDELMATSGRSWETAETRLLMDLRREMDHEFRVVKRNAVLWKKLSDRMHRTGYSRTDKQCKEKWKNLLSEYKRTEGQKEICEGEQQRIFPYYNYIKNILVKQPGSTLSSILDSPPPNLDHQPSSSPYHPAYNRSGQPNFTNFAERPSSSQYPYNNGSASGPFHEYSHPSTSMHNHRISHHWSDSKARDTNGKKSSCDLTDTSSTEETSTIYQVLELMRQEIAERRRWEEQIEARHLESRRREEARERRREKRERERARRQKYYTQILTTLASHITPNVEGYFPTVLNKNEKSSSDTEKGTYTTNTQNNSERPLSYNT